MYRPPVTMARLAVAVTVLLTGTSIVPHSGFAARPAGSGPAHLVAWGATAKKGSSGPLGKVRYIKRGLIVQPPKQKAGKGRVKQAVFPSYALRTGKRQLASLGFNDGTLLHMNEQTDAVLRSASVTYVQKGEVDQVVQPGSNHTVQTASAVASAIGTNLDVRSRGTRSVFAVVEGAALVKNARGSIVIKTGEQTTVVKGHAPGPAVPIPGTAPVAWTGVIPPPAVPLPQNIALDANGGSVVAASSQRDGTGWNGAYIDDGRLDRGWSSAQGQTTGSITMAFRDGAVYNTTGVVIDPAGTNGHGAAYDAREFAVRASTGGIADADFHTVATGTLQQTASLQRFDFPSPVRARYIQIVVTSNFGSPDGVDMAEVEILGQPVPVAMPTPAPTVTPVPTATPVPTGLSFAGVIVTKTWDPKLLDCTHTNCGVAGGGGGNHGAEISQRDVTTYSGSVCGDPYTHAWAVHAHREYTMVFQDGYTSTDVTDGDNTWTLNLDGTFSGNDLYAGYTTAAISGTTISVSDTLPSDTYYTGWRPAQQTATGTTKTVTGCTPTTPLPAPTTVPTPAHPTALRLHVVLPTVYRYDSNGVEAEYDAITLDAHTCSTDPYAQPWSGTAQDIGMVFGPGGGPVSPTIPIPYPATTAWQMASGKTVRFLNLENGTYIEMTVLPGTPAQAKLHEFATAPQGYTAKPADLTVTVDLVPAASCA